jgi:hypothetical protein
MKKTSRHLMAAGLLASLTIGAVRLLLEHPDSVSVLIAMSIALLVAVPLGCYLAVNIRSVD